MWDLTITSDHDFYIHTVDAGTVLVHNCPKDFSQSSKDDIWNDSANENGGTPKCASCDREVVRPQQSRAGVRPPDNEGQVDHIEPKSLGGEGIKENGQLLCRACNIAKSNHYPWRGLF
jgi:5-methylcytosine-specific restriction endonuclease McrA